MPGFRIIAISAVISTQDATKEEGASYEWSFFSPYLPISHPILSWCLCRMQRNAQQFRRIFSRFFRVIKISIFYAWRYAYGNGRAADKSGSNPKHSHKVGACIDKSHLGQARCWRKTSPSHPRADRSCTTSTGLQKPSVPCEARAPTVCSPLVFSPPVIDFFCLLLGSGKRQTVVSWRLPTFSLPSVS